MSPKWMLTFPSVSIPDTTVSLCLMNAKDFLVVFFLRGGIKIWVSEYVINAKDIAIFK